MAEINTLNNQSLFFAATQVAMNQATKNQSAKKNEKPVTLKKTIFANAIEQKIEEQKLLEEGLPIELAQMTQEEAIVFLKDQVDLSGDKLKQDLSFENVTIFKKNISNFIKYVTKNNYEIIRQRRPGRNAKGQPRDPYVQIRIIDEALESLVKNVLYVNKQGDKFHQSNLEILNSVDQLKGMIIDLLAS